jgi:hypothetical protein
MGYAGVVMETRAEPVLVQFSAGDVVEGRLESVDRVLIKGKPGVKYTVRNGELDITSGGPRFTGGFSSFFGTYQLNTKLRVEDRGHWVMIACVGEDQRVKRGGNCMKLFEVKTSSRRVSLESGPLPNNGRTGAENTMGCTGA